MPFCLYFLKNKVYLKSDSQLSIGEGWDWSSGHVQILREILLKKQVGNDFYWKNEKYA